MPDPSNCTHCGRSILWITDGRNRVAIDSEPLAVVFDLAFRVDDTAVKGYTREGSLVAGRRPREGETANGSMHLTHSRTCPESAAWRGMGRRCG